MLTPQEIDDNYTKPDPWGYQTCPADIVRKKEILDACVAFSPEGNLYERALDIGCGEGWITKDLPAKEIYGYELSEKARERFPPNVKQLGLDEMYFDLVTMTGVLYPDYNWRAMLMIALTCASRAIGSIIVTSHIRDREITNLSGMLRDYNFTQKLQTEFPYDRPEANYWQRLRVFVRG